MEYNSKLHFSKKPKKSSNYFSEYKKDKKILNKAIVNKKIKFRRPSKKIKTAPKQKIKVKKVKKPNVLKIEDMTAKEIEDYVRSL